MKGPVLVSVSEAPGTERGSLNWVGVCASGWGPDLSCGAWVGVKGLGGEYFQTPRSGIRGSAQIIEVEEAGRGTLA